MALMKCVDCGTEHSDEAVACPKCGKPSARAKMRAKSTDAAFSLGRIVLLLALSLIGLMVLAAVMKGMR